jgi:hypothetical protein
MEFLGLSVEAIYFSLNNENGKKTMNMKKKTMNMRNEKSNRESWL